jgi:hypothetical protein
LRVMACLFSVATSQCGGSPAGPSPPPNGAPVIRSVAFDALRTEVGTPVVLRAVVEDGETDVEKLTFSWTANGGTFTGTGPSVTWRAPADAQTPADYSVTLTVTETYSALSAGGALETREHRVVSSPAWIRVHNSPRELQDLGLRFLRAFADSRVSPDTCVAEFSESCRGKREELNDVRINREHYWILASTLIPRSVSVPPGYTQAEVDVTCRFTSRIEKCQPELPNCAVGQIFSVSGTCHMPAVYEQGRWWLCESRFFSDAPLTGGALRFFGTPGTPGIPRTR